MDSDPIHIVCVLKTGGDFSHKYANILFHSIIRNIKAPITFTCITNSRVSFHQGIKVVPLIHELPGWWSKMEMFRPGLWQSGRIWYFDLDTMIVGDLDIVLTHEMGDAFYALADFLSPTRVASGVMTWMANDPALTAMYERFMTKPERVMAACGTLGDQCWIGCEGPEAVPLQSLFPWAFASLKVHCTGGVPSKHTKVVCFHGKPRPHDAGFLQDFAWVKDHWKL